MNEFNMNTNQIINQLNQSHENFHHRLRRNETMNILNRNQYNTFSMNSNNNSNNQINMTEYNQQYNYNTINYDQNNTQFYDNNNNQNHFMNNNNIRMSVNYTNPQNNSYYNLNNNSRLMRQYSEPNLLEPKDVYYYINEEKKVIIFERNDQRQFRVKVPLSLRNNELYYTAIKYKINEFSDMDLFYDNNLLNNDDSSINNIPNGGKVIIVENLDEIKTSYYRKEYLPNLPRDDIINIIFRYSFGKTASMVFSKKTKIKDMFKMFFQDNKVLEKGKKYYKFTFNSDTLNINDDSPIGTLFNSDGKTIDVDIRKNENSIKGKELEVKIKNKGKITQKIPIGTLNQIKSLYFKIEQNYSDGKQIKNIFTKNIEIKNNDERTFSSRGIRNNFTCTVIFIDNKENEEEKEKGKGKVKNNKKNRNCLVF